MKNIWIIANWKSNKTISEALAWIDLVGPKLEKREGMQVVVCPAFTDIEEVKKAVVIGNYPIMVGAQDVSPYEEGPYTGEESARILSELVELSIIGHSERRERFQETDGVVAEKAEQAGRYKIIPLVCVQNENTPVPEGVDLAAYEPVFAIGTGNPDTPENAARVAAKLREKSGEDLQVLYGGSVNSGNAQSFLEAAGLDGLLIGRASLDGEEFLKIVKIGYAFAGSRIQI